MQNIEAVLNRTKKFIHSFNYETQLNLYFFNTFCSKNKLSPPTMFPEGE
jgi:hypothetical protein